MSEEIQNNSLRNCQKPTEETGEIRILIVDDEPVFHEQIPLLISKRGVRFFSARNSTEVFEILGNHEIDCVFMDFVLPDRTGIGITESIRKFYIRKKIYIIGMTTLLGGREAETCAAHGMNDFVRKPFNDEKLFEAFQRFLRHRSKIHVEK